MQTHPVATVPLVAVYGWHGTQKCFGIWMAWVGEQADTIRHLDDLTKIHHSHCVADVLYHSKIV